LKDTTLQALHRLRRYLRSAGRYGPSSFIIGHYGGAGEISQGFCRTAAVNGGVYILSKRILSLEHLVEPLPPHKTLCLQSCSYVITLEDFPEQLSCKLIISSPDYVPSNLRPSVGFVPPASSSGGQGFTLARCIAIIDQPISFHYVPESSYPGPGKPSSSHEPVPEKADNALFIFPPSSLVGGSRKVSATVLVMGEGSMSAPRGKCMSIALCPVLKKSSSFC
jgi:RAB protein geranylgeranyltransferase component A